MKKLTDNLRAGSLPDPTARAPARGALFHRCGGQSRERTVWPMTPTQNWSFPLLVWGQWGVLHRHLTTRSLAFHLCPITQKKPEKGHPLCVSDERAEAWNPGRHLVRRKEVGREPPARDIPGPKWGPETSFASFSLCFRWPGGYLFSTRSQVGLLAASILHILEATCVLARTAFAVLLLCPAAVLSLLPHHSGAVQSHLLADGPKPPWEHQVPTESVRNNDNEVTCLRSYTCLNVHGVVKSICPKATVQVIT